MTTTPPAEPTAPVYAQPLPPRSKRLGLLALLLAIVVLVLSVIVSVVNGGAVAPIADVNPAGGWSFNAEAGSSDPAESAVAIAGLLHVLLGSLFGIAALVLGIVAVASKRGRGRGFGVGAIIVAALAPIISLVVFAVTVTAALA